MRKRYLLAAAAMVITAVVAVPGAASAKAKGGGGGGGGDGLPPVIGKFSSVCFYDHTAPDDPIVFPGQPGASHSHDFISNDTTDAASTTQTLLAGRSNCFNNLDTAAYWVPTMFKNGVAIHPQGITVYYLDAVDQKVTPYPPGFKELAGNAHATSTSQASHIYWGCSTSFPRELKAPKCKSGEGLHVRIDFADCWNGRDLDSPDHVSHVAYSANGACPAGYPVLIPALSILVKYATNDGSAVTLASGGTYSMHADFFNAWDQTELTNLVNKCLNARVLCDRPTPGG